MLLQQQSGAMNVQLPPVGSVQQTTALTSQVQQTTINPVHSGNQQLTIQQQAPPPQQNLQQQQQQTNAITQVGHKYQTEIKFVFRAQIKLAVSATFKGTGQTLIMY